MKIEVRRTGPADKDFKALVSRLDDELRGRYGAEQDFFDVFNILDPNAHCVVLCVNGSSAGCGCLRTLEEPFTGEIKRMYITPGERGKGYARNILHALEAWAIELGMKRLILETGVKQPEAVAAYTSAGYSVIPNYGPYINSSYSICMQKNLV
jgi:GNAT superfamily N-acetyltransferase